MWRVKVYVHTKLCFVYYAIILNIHCSTAYCQFFFMVHLLTHQAVFHLQCPVLNLLPYHYENKELHFLYILSCENIYFVFGNRKRAL